MVNQEHLDILKQGVVVWNKWRKEYQDIKPDLRDTVLIEEDLSDADLSGTNLSGANLSKSYLFDANLIEAFLHGTNLRAAYLRGANLSKANLMRANCLRVSFERANFSEAIFSSTNLNETILHGANFSGTHMGWTSFGRVDLSMVKGLETVVHNGPSTIGIDTIYYSGGNIPDVFLKGAGVDDTFITYVRSLVGKPIDYYTCFISYSSKDEAFAKRLYADLQNNNVRCWFAPEDLKIGDKFRHRIDESIRVYDKLLLVLSEASLASTWVGYEVEKALDKEPEGKPNVLFPIRLDKAILSCETDWAKDIRKSRHIGDFEHWKDHDAYQIAFKRLLRDLKAQS